MVSASGPARYRSLALPNRRSTSVATLPGDLINSWAIRRLVELSGFGEGALNCWMALSKWESAEASSFSGTRPSIRRASSRARVTAGSILSVGRRGRSRSVLRARSVRANPWSGSLSMARSRSARIAERSSSVKLGGRSLIRVWRPRFVHAARRKKAFW